MAIIVVEILVGLNSPIVILIGRTIARLVIALV
jgi:hypothetical protein